MTKITNLYFWIIYAIVKIWRSAFPQVKGTLWLSCSITRFKNLLVH